MTETLTREALEIEARSLITVEPSSMGLEVTTPVIYPDGACISVIVLSVKGGYEVHDAGIASMRVASTGVRVGRDFSERSSVAAARYQCSVKGGRVMRLCAVDDVARSVMLVANASRSIADAAQEVRRQSENAFREALSEKIREIAGDRVRENEMFKGQSGTSYRVPSIILDEDKSRPIAFIVGIPSRNAVSSRFRELFDLKASHPVIRNESIYNENSDFRPDEDGWAFRQVGDLLPFSMISRGIPRLMEDRFH